MSYGTLLVIVSSVKALDYSINTRHVFPIITWIWLVGYSTIEYLIVVVQALISHREKKAFKVCNESNVYTNGYWNCVRGAGTHFINVCLSNGWRWLLSYQRKLYLLSTLLVPMKLLVFMQLTDNWLIISALHKPCTFEFLHQLGTIFQFSCETIYCLSNDFVHCFIITYTVHSRRPS